MVSMDRDFDPAADVNVFEFDSRQVIARETPIQYRVVSLQYGGVRPDAPDRKLGVQKFENGL